MMATPRAGLVDFDGLVASLLLRPPEGRATPRLTGHSPGGSTGAHPTQAGHNMTGTLETSGGYPDEIFLDLSETEKREKQCSICLLLPREPRQCPNTHIFCASCIVTWSGSPRDTNRKCPVCRTEGRYRPDLKLDTWLSRRRVKCVEEGCKWKGILREFRAHEVTHGKGRSESVCSLPPVFIPDSNINNLDRPTVEMSPRSLINGTPLRHWPGSTPADLNQRVLNRRRRINRLMNTFSSQLGQHGRNIVRFSQEREERRQEHLQEVEDLTRRLNVVSSDIMHTLGNMSRDNERYRNILRESQNLGQNLDTMLRQSTSPRDQRTPNLSSSNQIPLSTNNTITEENSRSVTKQRIPTMQSDDQSSIPRLTKRQEIPRRILGHSTSDS